MGVYFPSYRASGYHFLYSDPTSADTDGDGLSDYEETYERYEIVYTDSPAATRNFFRALQTDDQDPGDSLTVRSRDSSAMRADSDDDGLDDREEVLRGTDAKSRDTDGDGIPDSEEDTLGGDPTLFDAQPPRVEVWNTNIYKAPRSWQATYALWFRAADPSGVGRVAVVKGDDVQFADFPSDSRDISYSNVRFKAGLSDGLLDELLGGSAQIKAADRHGNEHSVTALERANYYGHVASLLEASGYSTHESARSLGMLSGLTVGAGETVKLGVSTAELVEAIATDPIGYVRGLTKIVEVLDKLHLLDDVIAAMPDAVVAQQEAQNPYDKETQPDLYRHFEYGWYGGYAGYFITEMGVTYAIGTALKGSKAFAKLVDTLDRDGKLTAAARYYSAAKGTATAPVRKAGYLAARGVVKGTDHSLSASRRVLSGVRTVGRQYTVSQSLRQVDPGFVDGLSNAKQRTLGRFLAQTDEAGPTLVADGGGDMLTIFRRMPDVDPKTVRRLDKLEDSGVISDTDIDRLVRAKEDGDIDGEDLRRITELLSDSADTSKYVSDDDVTINQILKLSERNGDLSQTQVVVEDRYGNVRWLERGDNKRGWVKIQKKHMTGEIPDGSKFPKDLSDEEVKDLIIRTIKKGQRTELKDDPRGGYKYLYDDPITGDEIKVVTGDNGYIVSAYPTDA